jgi:hypothetical protein
MELTVRSFNETRSVKVVHMCVCVSIACSESRLVYASERQENRIKKIDERETKRTVELEARNTSL